MPHCSYLATADMGRSVGLYCVLHASCPVTIVRPAPAEPTPVGGPPSRQDPPRGPFVTMRRDILLCSRRADRRSVCGMTTTLILDPLPAYAERASRYAGDTAAYQRWRDHLVELLPARPGDTALDVGCGTGLCLPGLLAKVGPSGSVIGIDAAPAMIALAEAERDRNGWHNVTLIAGPAERVTLDRPADAALFCAVHDVLMAPDALENLFAQAARRLGRGRRREVARRVERAVDNDRGGPAFAVRARLRRVRPAVAAARGARRRARGHRAGLRYRL